MIISTRRIEGGPIAGRTRSRAVASQAFTLAEVMIAATLSVFVLAGVLSAFLMIGRSGLMASNYSEMEAQTRRALDIFGQDARQATNLRWHSDQHITLTVPTRTGASQVTYGYETNPGSSEHLCFYRAVGDPATAPRVVLVRNVAAFAFQRYKLERTGVIDNVAKTDLETKQLQLSFRTYRAGAATVATNHSALSTRYILRNKRVSN